MRRLKSAITQRFESPQSGAVLVLVAASLVVLMGMAALAVDYGWLYYSQLNTRKAAEAAALAGVVHMPLPNCANPGAGTQPYISAIDVASRNGYSGVSGATVSPAMGGTCARLKVTINNQVDTFFLKVFGINQLYISEDATAEQLPALKLGSDEPYLGEDPDGGSSRDRNFFLAISGEDRTKGQGDAFAAQRRDGGGNNPEYVVPSYYYAFEIPVGSGLIGQTVNVQIYDPQAVDKGGRGNSGPNGNTNDWVYRDNSSTATDGWNSKTRFRVYQPDATPNQWTDNSTLVNGSCDDTYRGASDSYGASHSNYDPSFDDTWVSTCTIGSATSGTYVIEVSSDYGSSDGTDMINGFSIRGANSSGSPVSSSSDLQVYGLGSMSLWQFDTGSNPVFKIARLDEVYAGSSLIVSLWDVSDIGSSASIEFVGATSGSNPIDCEVRRSNDSGNPTTGWMGDSNGGSGSTCKLNFSNRQYNNQWLDFRFDVPADYTCPAGNGSSPSSPGCWIFVSYDVSGSITDRTTWSASIDGQPIHLIP